MSEISDAVQIIRVGFEGMEIAMKVGSASISTMQKTMKFIYGMLNFEKSMQDFHEAAFDAWRGFTSSGV